MERRPGHTHVDTMRPERKQSHDDTSSGRLTDEMEHAALFVNVWASEPRIGMGRLRQFDGKVRLHWVWRICRLPTQASVAKKKRIQFSSKQEEGTIMTKHGNCL